MSDKPIGEWRGGVDAKLNEHSGRIEELEKDNETRKNAMVRAMWWVIRLLLATTILTLATDKMKEKWLPIISSLGL